MDTFTKAYIDCALWSTTGEDDLPLNRHYTRDDFDADSIAAMVADCKRFQEENADDIEADLASAGHDFWWARNRYGAGFWDGDWPYASDRLTEASKAYGDLWLYVGDDGKLYL